MNPLIKIFTNSSLAEILCLFLLNPHDTFYQAQIRRESGKALIQVQRSLRTLEEVGLIDSEQGGHKVYYKANTSHPAFEDLKRTFLKTFAIGDPLQNALDAQKKTIQLAWIFGSVARGQENKKSDIDLCILSSLSLKELGPIISPLSYKLKKELNAIFLRPEELLNRYREEDPFIKNLIEQPKIWIIGNEADLGKLLKGI